VTYQRSILVTFTTKTVAKRAGTYMQPGHDGLHVNNITLRAAPWDVPEVKAVHPTPAAGKFEAISVRTPTIAKVRVPFADRFAEWDEDTLRDEWMNGIPEHLRRGYKPRNTIAEAPARPSAKSLRTVMDHLAEAPDTRLGVMAATGLSHQTMARVIHELRDTGMVTLTKCRALATFRLTDKGRAVLLDRADMAEPSTDDREGAVYDLLCRAPRGRAEIKSALGISDWVLDEALRALMQRGCVSRSVIKRFSIYAVIA
jgi:DNA-binding HxlR family transcriptional regulator